MLPSKRSRKRINFNPRSPHGERQPSMLNASPLTYFNPRSPHGERRDVPFSWAVNCPISIHAPRTGSDASRPEQEDTMKQFQSTLPARGATRTGRADSPPAPHFNPRSPHGERRTLRNLVNIVNSFQSTLPARGATPPAITPLRSATRFQSTLPARGATR